MKIAVLGPQAGVKAGTPPQSILDALPKPYACSWSDVLAEGLDLEEEPRGRLAPSPTSACTTPFWEWRKKCKDGPPRDFPPGQGQWEVICPAAGAAASTVGADTVQWDQLEGNSGIASGRRVFVTELGYIGLAPLASMVGDEICVLMGSKVPHAVRRDGETYRFVGECYVFGMMDGEVLEGLDEIYTEFLEFS